MEKNWGDTPSATLRKSSPLLTIDQTNREYHNDDQGRMFQNNTFHDSWGRDSSARAKLFGYVIINYLPFENEMVD